MDYRHATLALLLAVAVPGVARTDVSFVPSASGPVNHQRWTTRDGLVQQTVTDMLQANDNYLWLATCSGLARFDGAHFCDYEPDDTPQLANDKLVSLFEDEALAIGIGTVGKDIVRDEGQ